MDRWSVDPPFARFDVDIGFSNGEISGIDEGGGVGGGDGGCLKEVKDDNGDLFMVLEIDVDDGGGVRSGKAYGKLMGFGEGEEAVVLALEEGLELGCRMEVETVEEESVRVREEIEMLRLARELNQVSGNLVCNEEFGGGGLAATRCI